MLEKFRLLAEQIGLPLDGETSIEFGVKNKEHAQYVPNITGYFTIYRER